MKRYKILCDQIDTVGIPGDLHGEIVHKQSLERVVKQLSHCKILVAIGDNINCEYMLPATTQKTNVAELVDRARSELTYIDSYLRLLNDAKVGIMICGNHEQWWKKIADKHYKYKGLLWHEMLGVKDKYPNIECLNYNDAVLISYKECRDDTLIVHGDTLKASTKYGLNLHQVAQKYPHYNVVFGHTHKAGVLYHTDYNGQGESITRFVCNTGGLADRNKISYMIEPDYQYAYTILKHNVISNSVEPILKVLG